jgi:hypothetical protein
MPPVKEHVIDFANTDFKTHIVNNIIKPNYIDEIHDSTENRTMWKKRAMRFETCIEAIIKDKMAAKDEILTLRQYIDEYKELKDSLNTK